MNHHPVLWIIGGAVAALAATVPFFWATASMLAVMLICLFGLYSIIFNASAKQRQATAMHRVREVRKMEAVKQDQRTARAVIESRAPVTMDCPYCGAPAQRSERYCTHCGKSLKLDIKG